DPKVVADVMRLRRRHHVHIACITILVALLVLAARAIARALREGRHVVVGSAVRRMTPLAIGYAAYVALGGAVLASSYERGTSRPFVIFGIALGAIVILARAWGSAASPERAARGLRALLCAGSALAAAFLVLEGVDATYLDGVGL